MMLHVHVEEPLDRPLQNHIGTRHGLNKACCRAAQQRARRTCSQNLQVGLAAGLSTRAIAGTRTGGGGGASTHTVASIHTRTRAGASSSTSTVSRAGQWAHASRPPP